MPRLFCRGPALSMTRSPLALGFFLVSPVAALMAAGAAYAQAPHAGCTLASASFLAQPDQGNVTINCTGLSEAFGKQLAEIMTRILRNRVDPQMVLAKLAEVDRGPGEGVARTLAEHHRQLIIQSLLGKPPAQIAIAAHLAVEDSAEFAKAIAAPLLMVGWQIEGQQIRRAAPKSLEAVHGVALVVKDRGAPPPKALQLQAALAAAQIGAVLVSDPALAPDAALLWVGRRLSATPAEAAK
jgi:hypothetical protein